MFGRRYFEFNGQSSRDYGVVLVHDGGLFERQFGISRETVTDRSWNSPLPCLFGFEEKPLSGEIQIMSESGWTQEKKRAVCRWLFTPSYAPFLSADSPDMVYYLLFTGEQAISTGLLEKGFLTLHFECNAPWGWSKKIVQRYDLRQNEGTFRFDVNNISNVDKLRFNPLEIEIAIPEFTETDYPDAETRPIVDVKDLCFAVRNVRNTPEGGEFIVKSTPLASLQKGERLYVHMGRKKVLTSADVFSRMDNCNKKWVELEYGINTLEVTGQCRLEVRCQFPVMI